MHISYRAEIDGLRAIAVLAVIFYHAEFTVFGHDMFKGGYIGVDIFFVISGYLISKIIITELNKTNHINIANFYERRARRILPMLLTVILVSFPFAWQYLALSSFAEHIKSIIASLLFSSNIFFYFSTIEYGADSSLLKPLLHTWSLSVEEQYYILFPVTFLFCYKYFRNYIMSIVVVGILASLLLAEIMVTRNSDLNFYILPTRMWELLVGTLLAVADIKYGRRQYRVLCRILPAFGLFLILYAFQFFNLNTHHPGLNSTIPVIGAALVIFFSSKDELVGVVLGARPLVWGGLISYSLYLWHFPVFALARVNNSNIDEIDKLVWIAITFILSFLSFYIIEKPFRNRAIVSFKHLTTSLTALTAIIVILCWCLYPWNFYLEEFEDMTLENPTGMLDQRAYLLAWRLEMEKVKSPTYTDSDKTKILFIGNSHAVDSFNMFNQNKSLFPNYEFSIINPPPRYLDTLNYQVHCFRKFLTSRTFNCLGIDFNENQNLTALYEQADIIILSSRWNFVDLRSLDEIFSLLKAENKRVAVFGNTLEFSNNHPLKQFIAREKRIPTETELSRIENTAFTLLQNNQLISKKNSELRSISAMHKVPYFSKQDFLCDRGKKSCELLTPQGHLIIWDYGHYSLNGAKYLGQKMITLRWLEQL